MPRRCRSCWFSKMSASCLRVVATIVVMATLQVHECSMVTANEVPIVGEFGSVYENTISEPNQHVYHFQYIASKNQTSTVRIHTNSTDANDEYPVMFVVRQQEDIMSWKLPTYLKDKYEYDTVGRTLCPANFGESYGEVSDLYIEVSTSSPNMTTYQLIASIIDDFEIRHSIEHTTMPAPTIPMYYYFKFPNESDTVQIRASSDDKICAIMSIQNTICPVFDSIRNVEYSKLYQSMTTQTVITVNAADYDNREMFVVVVIYPDDSYCHNGDIKAASPSVTERIKTVNFTIRNTLPRSQYLKAILAAVFFFLSFYIIAPIIMCIHWRCYGRRYEVDETDEQGSHQGVGAANIQAEVDDRNLAEGSENRELEVSVATFAQKEPLKVRKKYKLYYWNLLPIAILYALPVIQLVFNHQIHFKKSGEQDVCYYNFLCAQPLGHLSAFNNVFSNIGYVLLGLLFMLMVAVEDYRHRKRPENSVYGIPKYFGLLYAIGLALVMEGIFSGCYHVCPSYSNFQFDTSFMYTIGGLAILKLYQTRHPDILANAHVSYLCLAFVICITLIGVVTGNVAFWVCFTVIHIIVCTILSFTVYFKLSMDLTYPREVLTLIKKNFCRRPLRYKSRFVLVVLVNVLNWVLAVFGVFSRPDDFATHLLCIFIANFLLYLVFYMITKCVTQSGCVRFDVAISLVLTIAFWIPAVMFFVQFLATWGKSPAESREGNRACILLDFYDHHDVWHFLSACGLFFAFVTILYMDGDLDGTKRTEIHAF